MDVGEGGCAEMMCRDGGGGRKEDEAELGARICARKFSYLSASGC